MTLIYTALFGGAGGAAEAPPGIGDVVPIEEVRNVRYFRNTCLMIKQKLR